MWVSGEAHPWRRCVLIKVLVFLLVALPQRVTICSAAAPNPFPDGFPTIPLDGYPTYDMRSSTIVYFVGNDTGMNNHQELVAQTRFGIVGIGWQLNMRCKL